MSEISEKSIFPDSYLLEVYDGNIEESDEMYNKIYYVLKDRCDVNNVSYSENIKLMANTIFKAMVDSVKEENHVEISFSDIDNFEEDFLDNINKVEIMPLSKRNITIDSITNRDFMHNPTTSIMLLMQEYIASKMEALCTSVCELMMQDEFTYSDTSNEFDPFADSLERPVSEEAKEKYKNEFEFFMMLPEFSNMFRVADKYRRQVSSMKASYLIEEIGMKSPEYVEELQKLLEQKDENITYFYHGAPSQAIADKIINEGLYMQYGEITRTAKPNLSLSEILTYSYGYENVGRNAVVVIAAPNGKNIVDGNYDKNVMIAGTSQGLEQGDFNPKYKISNQYIVGYIDKDKKTIVRNPNYTYGINAQDGEKAKTI